MSFTPSNGVTAPRLPAMRWGIAFLISAAIAISYLDRQTFPWAIGAISKDIPISNEAKATLDSAFLVTYGLMYLGGGWLLDRLGTRRGFLLVMVFWSLACAAHGLAGGLFALGACRLLLGMGEGGGFPAGTRAVAEWFPVGERSTAMGIINGGTGVGGVVAPPLIALILLHVGWLDLSAWRWVFFLTGALGLVWAIWWWLFYFPPGPAAESTESSQSRNIGLRDLLRFREVWAVVIAKFLTDAAWYFYLFWLPKYLLSVWKFDIKQATAVGWIPYAASGVGCVCGGGLSSWLIRRGGSVNRSRKWALAASAALMPWVMLVPVLPNIGWVIAIFSLAFFGQQSWSTLIMVLPTDLVPKEAVGRVAGLVGMGGAFGGVVLGQLAGYLLDHGFTYAPILCIAASLHVVAFLLICLVIRVLQPLPFPAK
jgi:ACS family hexuronate transporter-like MFS transporter